MIPSKEEQLAIVTECHDALKMENNPYVADILRVVKKQTLKGVRKYGATMRDNPLNLTPLEVVEYALEEVADAMVYLCKVREMLGGE